MLKKYLSLLALLTFPLSAQIKESALKEGVSETRKIEVNNRVLAQVNGKAISALDVMKNLEVVFFEQFPQYHSSLDARYQFFVNNWRPCLKDMIDRELVLAEAEQLKMVVTTGDIRQELQARFGPKVLENLEQMGLTYDEAFDFIKTDITLRRVLGARVNAPVINGLQPKEVRQYYQQYANELDRKKQWAYQVITFRSSSIQKAQAGAQMAYHLLVDEQLPLNQLREHLKALPTFPPSVKVTVSDMLQQDEGMLSQAYKEVLNRLSEKTYSAPIALKSRADSQSVVRIFYLDQCRQEAPSQFAEMESSLRQELINQRISEKTRLYLDQLQEKFPYQNYIDASDRSHQAHQAHQVRQENDELFYLKMGS